jgi:hypothetical protein
MKKIIFTIVTHCWEVKRYFFFANSTRGKNMANGAGVFPILATSEIGL